MWNDPRSTESGLARSRRGKLVTPDEIPGGAVVRYSRVLLAGFLGGVAIFIWASIAHQATPLDDVGVATLPHQEQILPLLRESLGSTPTVFYFPGPGAHADMAATPFGVLIYRPPGMPAGVTGPRLFGEFVAETIQATIAAFLLAQTVLRGFFARVAFVAAIGLAGALTTNATYWLIPGYPGNYTLAYGFIDLMRYVFAGLVIAAVLKPAEVQEPIPRPVNMGEAR